MEIDFSFDLNLLVIASSEAVVVGFLGVIHRLV